VGVLIGLYVFWVGASHPGGAFQGATILAAMWLLAMMAGLADVPSIGDVRVRAVLVAGAAVFLAVGLVLLGFGDGFLAYPPAFAKALIIGIEVAMTATVAVTLVLLIAGTPERRA
jgi:multisubunit Na+/H+ antiporter MnhB subunit